MKRIGAVMKRIEWLQKLHRARLTNETVEVFGMETTVTGVSFHQLFEQDQYAYTVQFRSGDKIQFMLTAEEMAGMNG
jgi:hypothetical protein